MSDKKIILTVRATKDGVYDNYLWKGPITSDEGYTPGEVFKIDATPYIAKDDKGNPVFELNDEGKRIPVLDAKGKPVLNEKGKMTFKIKMATMFSNEWMERVADDTELTYPDRPAWTIPEAYKIKKQKPVRTVALPPELGGVDSPKNDLGLPTAVNEALGLTNQLEEVA